MKLTGLFKRGAACLCTAAILMGGVSAFALSPALPDEPAPAELSVTNAVSEAQLRSAVASADARVRSLHTTFDLLYGMLKANRRKPNCKEVNSMNRRKWKGPVFFE